MWNCWKIRPILSRRMSVRRLLDSLEISTPSSSTSPLVGLSIQPMMFIMVDLPEPEGPMMATHSPLSTCRLTLSSALSSP